MRPRSVQRRAASSPEPLSPSAARRGQVVALHLSVPGRTRFLVPGLYRCHPLKAYLESRLGDAPDVLSFSANLLTGHLLVLYRAHRPPRELAAFIEGLVADFHSAGGESPSAATGRQGPARSLVVVRRGAPQEDRPWHLLPREAAAAHFGSSLDGGLSDKLAASLMKRFGPNLLPEALPRSGLTLLLEQFKSLPVLLLVAASALSLATAGVADAVAILAVVTINAGIGFLTERQAERTIHGLKTLAAPTALVLREGVAREVAGAAVVPGDLLLLRPGTRVTADCRIVASRDLTIDESALTGESMPVAKSVPPLADPALPLADRVNMAYQGTVVTGGQGSALAVGTGRFTEIGAVKALAGEARPPDTPLERELDQVGKRLVLLYGGVCGIVFLAGLWRGMGLLRTLRSSISLAVAAIPEGLPTVATTILALGVQEMKGKKILIRHLAAAETLGSVQTLCLDKTGTLTVNRMSVVSLHVGMREVRRSEGRFTTAAGPLDAAEVPELARLMEVLVLCNESEISSEGGGYRVTGSATETSFIALALDCGQPVAQLRGSHPPLRTVLRSAARNYMLTVHPLAAGDPFPRSAGEGDGAPRRLLALKGAPEEVLALCTRQLRDGAIRHLSEEERGAIELANERMAGASLRVLGCAYAALDAEDVDDAASVEGGLVWLGLVGMADPLRPGVKALMGVFHQAGVDTVMITGDQVSTAYAIGRDLGLSRDAPLQILDSAHLQEMDLELLAAFAPRVQVFARVTPAQKLQIVQALQKGGRVVAMTGDGINDGPALKAADVGIAMGSAGTEVAREVADVVLEEDNLETMVIAMSHGRTIYDNIRKSVRFLLATNLSEIMVMLLAVGGGLGEPLNAMQLLWINLISDIFPGLALALEPPEPDVLRRPPADPQRGVVSDRDFAGIAWQGSGIGAGALAAYGYGVARYGAGARAGTLAFTSLTCAQLLQALSCRSEKASLFHRGRLPANPYLTWALAGSFGVQAATFLVPGLRRFLKLAPIGLLDGLVIGAASLIPLLASEASKPWSTGEPP